jgi:Bacterial mobilisation protein (MobC)
MARRSKEDAGERYTDGLRLQLTPSERAVLEQRAQTAGLTLSAFARFVLLSDLKAPAPAAYDPQAVRNATAEVSRVGNNVNQMAKHAHQTGALPEARELRAIGTDVKAAMVALIKVMAA